jgi:hypothetical protein
MKPQAKNWDIKLVKDRYNWLKPTLRQAEEILNYEQERDTYSEKFYFSDWEEWDYELTVFRRILNSQQLKVYEVHLQEKIKRHESNTIEFDLKKIRDIKYHEEIVKFYEEQLLPKVLKIEYISILNFPFSVSKLKVDFLKAEYKQFLNDSKKEILTNHFRYNRTFAPNALTVALLLHKQCCLWPDYSSFKHKMDESTKAAADHLKTKLMWIPDEMEKQVVEIFDELAKFRKKILKTIYKEKETKGWHVVIGRKLSADEEKELRLMTLLLLD